MNTINLTKIKKLLDSYFATYSDLDTEISIYGSSIFYSIFTKRIESQNFSNRIESTGLRIFEISPYENNLIYIRFFVNTKALEQELQEIV